MNTSNSNRCGFCTNFKTNEEDIHLIPVGSCENKGIPEAFVDFHHTECNFFTKKPGLARTINCSGCNFELWPEFTCNCSRNYTSNYDSYQKDN